MQFIDLAAQQARIREKIEANIKAVLDHGRYIMGPEITELEKRLAEFAGVAHAVGAASGTDALLMALMAKGVGPGDAVFLPPFTFVATAEVVSLLGATPVFVDVEADTFNICPGHLKKAVEALRTKNPGLHPLPGGVDPAGLTPKGVIPVDLFGLPADYQRINAVAEEEGLFVIEDAAQSFGALYHGRRACSLAGQGCTSFFPAKPLGGYGDGGMVFTDDAGIAALLRSIRVHGQGSDKYQNVRIGINGRLDSLQAAILLAKFEIFPEELELRRQVADRYNRLIEARAPHLVVPAAMVGLSSAWAQYSVLAQTPEQREEALAKLKAAGIPSMVYYPVPLHLQPAYENLGYKRGDFPISEDSAGRIFSLPMHPYLAEADQEKVVAALA